jgi:ribonuclease HI
MVFYYAVACGRQTGIYMTWPECNEQVKNFKGASFKKFDTRQEAENFIADYQTRRESRSSSIVSDESTDDGFVPEYYIYTDGACINNGRPDAAAGIGVYFGEDNPRNISRRLDESEKQTNNVAELMAIKVALELLSGENRVMIVSDSQYAISCATTYGAKCAADNWHRDIPNRDLAKQVYEMYQARREYVRLMHVMAHTGAEDIHSRGNAGADRLANGSVGQTSCPYAKTASSRIYLRVPYAQKEEAKGLGAKWDPACKKWYIYDDCLRKEQILDIFYVDA